MNADIETGDGDVLGAAGVDLPPEPEIKGPLKPISETNLHEQFVGGLAAAAIGVSLATIFLYGGVIVLTAGVLSAAMGPYAYYQQTKFTDIVTLKETAEAVQGEKDRLENENDRLSQSVEELRKIVEDLQGLEEVFDAISSTQEKSVEALERQVQQNERILKKMKKNVRGHIVQNLMSVVYRGDEDGNDIIDEEETEEIITNLRRTSNLKIREDRLRTSISNKPVDSVIEVVKNLMNDDLPEEEQIFYEE